MGEPHDKATAASLGREENRKCQKEVTSGGLPKPQKKQSRQQIMSGNNAQQEMSASGCEMGLVVFP